MKHYLFLKVPFIPSGNVKGFAPFEGTVRIQTEQSGNGAQVFVMNDSGWTFVFFHGDPLVQNGDKVKEELLIFLGGLKIKVHLLLPLVATLRIVL